MKSQKKFLAKVFKNTNPGMAFLTSQLSNKTLASGIKEVDNNLDLVNMIHYKPTEYNEIIEESKEFCHPPVKVQISSFNNLD